MTIKVGDKVRFLNATGGGYVTRIEGRLAFVEDQDGFELPILMGEIVPVERPEVKEESKKEAPNSAGNASATTQDDDYEFEDEVADDSEPRFYLAFLAGDQAGVQTGNMRVQLVNDSNYFSFYTINELGANDQAICLYHGELEPNTKLALGKQLVTELDDKHWSIQLILFKKRKRFVPQSMLQSSHKLKGAKLLKGTSFIENDYFHEKAVLMPILKGKMEIRLEQLNQSMMEKSDEAVSQKISHKVKRQNTPEILEVDLHIHELLDDTRGLSNGDMLTIQLDKFNQVMQENIKNKKKKIVFIHGVGNGTLKIELRKELERKYKNHVFQDASFREYGYGATLVII